MLLPSACRPLSSRRSACPACPHFVVQIALGTIATNHVLPETGEPKHHDPLPLLGCECTRDRHRNSVPLIGFFAQLSLPGSRKPVVLGASIVLGRFPNRSK